MNPADADNERQIVLDTETTGLSAANGDRIVEIACIELLNRLPTGRTWHAYVNPERDMPEEARKVHGLTREFLSKHPVFRQVADDFLAFVGDSPIVAHNANFDAGFLNAELTKARRPRLDNRIIDTVALARKRFPGARVTLDDLCKRLKIDSSRRALHGAMVDIELLAQVYLELLGGRHRNLELEPAAATAAVGLARQRPFRAPRDIGGASPEELARHAAFLPRIKQALWAASAPSAVLSAPGF